MQYNPQMVPSISLEYEQYINEEVEEESTDPLDYWKNAIRFPNLRILATKYHCVMGTSAPSERLFSHAGNVLTIKRSRLTAENLGKLVFMSQCEEEDFELP